MATTGQLHDDHRKNKKVHAFLTGSSPDRTARDITVTMGNTQDNFNQSTESTVQQGFASCRPSIQEVANDPVNLLPDISSGIKKCCRLEGEQFDSA